MTFEYTDANISLGNGKTCRLRMAVLVFAVLISEMSMKTWAADINPEAHGEQKLFSKHLPPKPNYSAPDGSDVRLLVQGDRGSMAHFQLAHGRTSKAVAHRTVEEVWYFITGHGEMWRKLKNNEEITEIYSGVSINLPVGTHFQFRAFGDKPLVAIAVTMPPWPGRDEAYEVPGKWALTSKDVPN